MKLLVLSSAFLTFGMAIKWDQVDLNPAFKGQWNNDEKYWTPSLSECEGQCTAKTGFVCGKNQKQCCKNKASCVNKFGF